MIAIPNNVTTFVIEKEISSKISHRDFEDTVKADNKSKFHNASPINRTLSPFRAIYNRFFDKTLLN